MFNQMEQLEMEYSIKPDKHELEDARRRIEETVQKYDYSLEIEGAKFNLGWQRFEKDCSVVAGDGVVTVMINPERDLENLEKHALRGLLHLEFREKAAYRDVKYNWQEIAMMAYVNIKFAELRDEELAVEEDIGERWEELKPKLEKETEQFDEELYMNAGLLAKAIAKLYREQNKMEDLPVAKRADIIKAGDELFG